MNYQKYRPYPPLNLKNRRWPDQTITTAPIWCSVDLRDGNQALEIPMNLEQKLKLFHFLVKMGFKEIEVGFPAASETEFKFVRKLIEDNLIPEDVTIQVLTQAREHIIKRTFEALEGAKRAIVHLYNSTSVLQREVVFKKNKEEIKALAVEGTKIVKALADEREKGSIILEYSPESFTGTEVDYAVEICEAVMDVWQPTPEHKAIINLPATVEMSTPNIYADQIEYFGDHIKGRDSIIISVHTHNDRGTAVAASELAILAGAERVEGTLFGNGERTGNADIITLGMNLFSQGIDPELDFSDANAIVEIYKENVRMDVSPRHPYVGDLVYTAFSGSHQDAIKKGMDRYKKEKPKYWEVPYLPIDPADIGRSYDPIIRINSQSGKGGVSYILENEFGFRLPRSMQQEFSVIITNESDYKQEELSPQEIYDIFIREYTNIYSPVSLKKYNVTTEDDSITISAIATIDGTEAKLSGEGNGPIDALCNALTQYAPVSFKVVEYEEHSLEQGSNSRAVSYIKLQDENGKSYFGAGIHSNINTSSIQALINAFNKMVKALTKK
ncbi:2-isopropylmalate synthase [Defluviitalea raffinosedens]|uniref:2-isopropylmalate synthase n=2 Tax=Defluviitalea raffinosedens TaxID=1450156 RepID=A0A7C8LQ81_9FIRM|nr:2-isopropylmalate synthase [Defluviitalea raffinosedens]KAE9634545.1 2-isopropylmalate synthase [Defluviitalea raffinosedens]